MLTLCVSPQVQLLILGQYDTYPTPTPSIVSKHRTESIYELDCIQNPGCGEYVEKNMNVALLEKCVLQFQCLSEYESLVRMHSGEAAGTVNSCACCCSTYFCVVWMVRQAWCYGSKKPVTLTRMRRSGSQSSRGILVQ